MPGIDVKLAYINGYFPSPPLSEFNIKEPRVKPGQKYKCVLAFRMNNKSFLMGDTIFVNEPTTDPTDRGVISSLGNWKVTTKHGEIIVATLEKYVNSGHLLLEEVVLRCECGAEVARTTHSTWCPKHINNGNA